MSFSQMDIPVGYAFKQLLYSAISHKLVLQTCSSDDSWRPERLYVRREDAEQYRAIEVPNDLISHESPFIHSSKPLLAFVSTQHKLSIDGEGRQRHFGDWHSLTILNLEDGSKELVNETNLEASRRNDKWVDLRRYWVRGVRFVRENGIIKKQYSLRALCCGT